MTKEELDRLKSVVGVLENIPAKDCILLIREIDHLKKQLQDKSDDCFNLEGDVTLLEEKVTHLNRLMPHIGSTCRYWSAYINYNNSCGTEGCTGIHTCNTDKCKLKE